MQMNCSLFVIPTLDLFPMNQKVKFNYKICFEYIILY